MNVEYTLLQQFLFWVLGPGAGVVAWWLLGFVQRHNPEIDGLSKEHKTYLAIIVSAALAIVTYLTVVALGYLPTPINDQMWVEGIFAVAGSSFGLSQIIHAATEKRGVHRDD